MDIGKYGGKFDEMISEGNLRILSQEKSDYVSRVSKKIGFERIRDPSRHSQKV